MKPDVGQVWRFGGDGGRQDTIRRVITGAAGIWTMVNGRMVPKDPEKSTNIYIQWKSGYNTISVDELNKHWTFVK